MKIGVILNQNGFNHLTPKFAMLLIVKFSSLQLNYNERETVGPCIQVYFQDVKSPTNLPMERAVETALNALKASTTESYYRKQAWEVIKCFLVAMMNLDDEKKTLSHLFSHVE